MITYVINTSENKTLDSDQLFKLGGYNKIRWMNYGLNELEKCADEICEKQTILGADDFRIAILVDFYGFDRVRSVYGSQGYSPIESGVDLSVYFPLLEAYIVDHLFSGIQRKELFVREKHIFYIQDDNHDSFNVIDNLEDQIKYILEPEESSVTEVITLKVPHSELENSRKAQEEKEESKREMTEDERQAVISEYNEKFRELTSLREEELIERQRELDKKKKDELENADLEHNMQTEEIYVDVPCKRYSDFRLYCTKSLSLDIRLTDYPYTNKKGLTFHEFYLAFKQRESQYNGITRYHFRASFGSGAAKAAFDNLSLSLFLIKLYERDEPIKERSEFVVDNLEPEKLKNMLVTAWNKICSAKSIALNNSSLYYDIRTLAGKKEDPVKSFSDEKSNAEMSTRSKAHDELKELSPEQIIAEICKMTSESADTFSERDKQELDELMTAYLKQRDDTKETTEEYEFRAIKEDCQTTSQCPSRNDYENVIAKKKEAIADLLGKTIKIEYLNKDYTQQKKESQTAYDDYTYAKHALGASLFGDILLCVFMLVVMLAPFVAIGGSGFEAVGFYVLTALLFAGLFLLAFFIKILPLISKLNDAKRRLRNCYVDCRVKQDLAILNYKSRYEHELIKIENLRYELRSITRLYKYNLAKNKNIEEHRQMLETVENRLSAMLNNLGVEPVVVRYKNLEDEFDVNRSIMSNYNKIYKIFSIDAIESLFEGKGAVI